MPPAWTKRTGLIDVPCRGCEFDGVCVTSAEDVREMLGVGASPRPAEGGRTDETSRLPDALSPRAGREVADVAHRAGFACADAQTLVGLAELEGRAARGDYGLWRSVTRRERL